MEVLKDESNGFIAHFGQVIAGQVADAPSVKMINPLAWAVQTSQNIHEG
jgi:hypothetical protein